MQSNEISRSVDLERGASRRRTRELPKDGSWVKPRLQLLDAVIFVELGGSHPLDLDWTAVSFDGDGLAITPPISTTSNTDMA